MAVRLILVCKEGPFRNAYLREAMSIGIEVDAVSTFAELLKSMLTVPYQGIMVDLVTSVKASREEKGIAQTVLDAFPMVQLRWDPQTNAIYTISTGSSSSSTLAHFVAHECQPFRPRAIRLDVRKSVNFNVQIFKDQDLNPAGMERSISINISRGGCFLCSFQNWQTINNVWVVVKELEDKTPIAGEIRWRQPWGKFMVIPGFGMRVTQMTDNQKLQIVEQFNI